VQHEPCRLLGNLHVPSNLVGRKAVLAVSDHPSCHHPLVEADGRILHDGADFDGELAHGMMDAALPDAALGIELYFVGAASGAGNGTVRPASERKVVDAVIRIREVDDCLLQGLWFGHGLVLHVQTVT
jgi:hypothetical protein